MAIAFLALTVQLSLGGAGDWETLTADLVKAEKPGYGGVSGVVVERGSGAVLIWLSDKGLYRSADHGQTWKPFGKPAKGRTETPGCMLANPAGPLTTLVIPLVYGAPIIVSDGAGETWRTLDKKSMHVDWVAANWTEPPLRFLLTLKHEAGGLLLASEDGGGSFREVGKNFGFGLVFNATTAVVARTEPGEKPKTKKSIIVRTTDACQSFEPVAEFAPRAIPVHYGKHAYWLTDTGVMRSMDQGKTWERTATLKGGVAGPVFGKDAQHQFVLTTSGIAESKDGGATWAKAIPLPAAMKGASSLSWVAYDCQADIVYVMKMGSDLFRLRRSSK